MSSATGGPGFRAGCGADLPLWACAAAGSHPNLQGVVNKLPAGATASIEVLTDARSGHSSERPKSVKLLTPGGEAYCQAVWTVPGATLSVDSAFGSMGCSTRDPVLELGTMPYCSGPAQSEFGPCGLVSASGGAGVTPIGPPLGLSLPQLCGLASARSDDVSDLAEALLSPLSVGVPGNHHCSDLFGHPTLLACSSRAVGSDGWRMQACDIARRASDLGAGCCSSSSSSSSVMSMPPKCSLQRHKLMQQVLQQQTQKRHYWQQHAEQRQQQQQQQQQRIASVLEDVQQADGRDQQANHGNVMAAASLAVVKAASLEGLQPLPHLDSLSFTAAPAEATPCSPHALSRHLWLGNLHQRLSRSTLRVTFEIFGPVDDVVTFPGRMYAFVNFKDAADAARAAEALHVRAMLPPCPGAVVVQQLAPAHLPAHSPCENCSCICCAIPQHTPTGHRGASSYGRAPFSSQVSP